MRFLKNYYIMHAEASFFIGTSIRNNIKYTKENTVDKEKKCGINYISSNKKTLIFDRDLTKNSLAEIAENKMAQYKKYKKLQTNWEFPDNIQSENTYIINGQVKKAENINNQIEENIYFFKPTTILGKFNQIKLNNIIILPKDNIESLQNLENTNENTIYKINYQDLFDKYQKIKEMGIFDQKTAIQDQLLSPAIYDKSFETNILYFLFSFRLIFGFLIDSVSEATEFANFFLQKSYKFAVIFLSINLYSILFYVLDLWYQIKKLDFSSNKLSEFFKNGILLNFQYGIEHYGLELSISISGLIDFFKDLYHNNKLKTKSLQSWAKDLLIPFIMEILYSIGIILRINDFVCIFIGYNILINNFEIVLSVFLYFSQSFPNREEIFKIQNTSGKYLEAQY